MYAISKFSTPTLIQSQINLGFHCFCLEITWKIHQISCHQRGGNPVVIEFVTQRLLEVHLSHGYAGTSTCSLHVDMRQT